jgi:RNA polymerase sigma-70 factor (ECF subfamily)
VGREDGPFDTAFREFFARDYASIVTGVTMIVGNRALATEAVDEAVARAWIRARRGEDIASLGAWIRVVAGNVARNACRSRAAEQRARERLEQVPAAGDQAAGWSIDIQRALAKLSCRQREVTVLRYMFDLSVHDIAIELDIAEGTVKHMLFRARAVLAEVLGDDTPAEEVHLEVG